MASEIEYVWLPLAALWAAVALLRRRVGTKPSAEVDSQSNHPIH